MIILPQGHLQFFLSTSTILMSQKNHFSLFSFHLHCFNAFYFDFTLFHLTFPFPQYLFYFSKDVELVFFFHI